MSREVEMKKVLFAMIVLALATMACSLGKATPEPPTAVPLQSTELPQKAVPTSLPSQPTAEISPTQEQAQSTTLPYFTDFASNDMGWDYGSNESSSINFEDGRLVFEVNATNWETWSSPNTLQFSKNMVLEVEAQHLAGPEDGQYGFICGYDGGMNYTALVYGEDGYAEIYRLEDGAYESLASAWGEASTPGTVNRLRAFCLSNRLRLEVNGQELVSTSAGTQPGQVGLVAGVFDASGMRVAFDAFNVKEAPAELVESENSPTVSNVDGSYFDDFSSDTGAWDLSRDPDFSVSLSNGELLTKIFTPYLDISLPFYRDVSGPVRVELDGRWVSGNKMVAYGLLCGQTNEIYYGMNITETGYAEVFRWKKGIRTPIWERRELSVIQSGGNHLAAECSGHDLRFYINDELVAELREYFEIDGGVGVVVGSYGSGNVSIAVDNFTVIPLSE